MYGIRKATFLSNLKMAKFGIFPLLDLRIKLYILEPFNTYKWKVSLNLGDQLLDLDFVACFLFLSAKCGPIKFTSTKGLNMPVTVGHFRSLAATTVKIYRYYIQVFLRL
jgi:hypothetical protein